MLVNWRSAKRRLLFASDSKQEKRRIERRAAMGRHPAYALLKLLFLSDEVFKRETDGAPPTDDKGESYKDFFKPYSSTFDGMIRHEPSIVPLLLTNNRKQIENAFKRAAGRLKISGFTPFTDDFYLDERRGSRLAAALLIPLAKGDTGALCRAVLRPIDKDSATTDNGEENR